MTIHWYAIVIVLTAIWLWLRGTVLDSVISVLFFSLFGGGAAFIVGGASITPASFAVALLFGHALLSMFRGSDHINRGLRTNAFLIFYCLYGIAMAYVLPRAFANTIALPPLKAGVGHETFFAATPLHYSNQNLTTAIYLFGALVASICAGAASIDPKSRRALVSWTLIISWIHIVFGIAGSVLTAYGGYGIIRFFRNATYAELTQTEESFSRISGVFPEASAYAGFAFIWFVLTTELWLRNVSPRATATTALALGIMIVACTSSSGYVALVAYAFILSLRMIIAPRSVRLSKVIPVAMIGLGLIALVISLAAFVPDFSARVDRLFSGLTTEKLKTISGRQRLYWAEMSLKAFTSSWGLGVGPGSFRSSGFIFAVLGSTGLIGLGAFTSHLIMILKPLRRDTYAASGPRVDAIPIAAAWAACIGLIPGMVGAPTPVPGYTFAIVGGLALGWRYRETRARRRTEWGHSREPQPSVMSPKSA